MRILAIETSTKNLGIAIADEDSILAEYKGDSELKHSQDLIPNIDLLLKDLGSDLTDIDAFAISIGPGSFTGLRVGVSALKGLNLVTDIPIITVPTLDVIAYNAINISAPICVIVDAKKNNLYSSLYTVENGDIIRSWDYLLIHADELIKRVQSTEHRTQNKEILFLGDGIGLYGSLILGGLKGARLADRKYWFPDPKVVAHLARIKFRRKEFQNPESLVPMYMYSRECNIRGVDR